jgi:Family of unknown function (DUF6441)
MNNLRLIYSAVRGELAEGIEAMIEPIARAGTAAIIKTADQIKLQGNQAIRAAGFSMKWANALKVNTYPKTGISVRAALLAYHKISYAGIFDLGSETSATIHGKPYLWIPVPGLPKQVGGKRMTPRVYEQNIGPLKSAQGRRGPLLVGSVKVTKRNRNAPPISLSRLRAGASGGPGTVSVPLFFAVRTATLRKRFNLERIFDRAADNLPALYDSLV